MSIHLKKNPMRTKNLQSISVVVIFNLSIVFTAFGWQTENKTHTTVYYGSFCGANNLDDSTFINIYKSDLKDCDFILSSLDSGYTIVEFQFSLVPIDDSSVYIEELIESSMVPEKFKNTILTKTIIIYLEKIKAKNKDGMEIMIKPFGIKIGEG